MKASSSLPGRRAASLLLFAAAILASAFFLNPAGAAPDTGALADELLKRADMNRGLCAVLGRDGDLAIDLAGSSELLVHVREPSVKFVNDLRAQARKAGFDIRRFAVERGPLDKLPYADNSVDIIVSTRADGDFMKSLSVDEVLRALRPEGIAIIGSAGRTGDPDELSTALRDWAGTRGMDTRVWEDNHGTWAQFRKPALQGADDWSHWEKSPDNNPVSNDALIKAPYMTQFMATPFYIGMPAITTAAGGRTFLAMGHIAHHEREWEMLNRIIARNGYNGAVLWERKLPDDYIVHRSAFIATKDIYYMMNGDHALMLDTRTGEEKGKIEIPGVESDWKWMGMVDGVLYVLAGEPGPGIELVKGTRALGGWSWADLSSDYYPKRIPHGFGDTIAAFDVAANKVLWTHKEDTLIDARGLAIQENRFFLYCPDKHLRALNRKSGKELWTNADMDILGLIEEPGKGLTSTPGWRTQTLIVATPKALVIQGQTRMNVVGISAADGRHLWTKQKITNNPNALFMEGTVIVGVGPGGSNVALDPVSGEVVEDFKFSKRACTRLTASTDSLFCRGEGMTRFDLESRELTVDGAVRPACNDGVIPANGLIYLGPWACDCNLSLIGNVARCSAGDFRFDAESTPRQLETPGKGADIAPLEVTPKDWPTYRADNARSSGTKTPARPIAELRWTFDPELPFTPSEATAAGGLVFFGGDSGEVRALDAKTGEARWTFATAGVVKYPPAISENRAYFGSADGYAYCVEAATGRMLWRFRAAPMQRHIMVYGTLSSTWPVNTGVLVHDGVAYFAAGIVDHDGTYVTALDAKSGKIVWQNTTSGHLNESLRKGVSAQGNLTIMGDALVLAGGNVISPAFFDLATGECLEQPKAQGSPQSNAGKYVGVFRDGAVIAGGRILHSSPRNVATKGSFEVWPADKRMKTLVWGAIPPAWDDDLFVIANFKYGRLTSFDAGNIAERIGEKPDGPGNPRDRFNDTLFRTMTARSEENWQSALGDMGEFEAVSIVVAPNGVITTARYQDLTRAKPQWFVTALNRENGHMILQQELPGDPLPGGLLVDRDGQTIVTLLDGRVVCYGPRQEVAER